MKRRPRKLFKLLLFLLAGTIINVAVAWGCASPINKLTAKGYDGHAERIAPFLDDEGAARVRFKQSAVDSVPVVEWTTGVGVRRFLSNPCSGRKCIYIAVSAGLPIPSLVGSKSELSGTGTTRNGLIRVFESQRIELPIRPLWPGFAINTIFYAAVLWVLFAVPVKARRWRRIKRGQCASCGYSLRGSGGEKCPECGATA